VKVADFGLAKLVGPGNDPAPNPGSGAASSALTDAGKIMGTPAYMAPEQAEHPADVDHRTDIYALGVVFYQMLTGELPPKPLQPPSRKVQIDVRLDEVVLHALERAPERRYQQASQVKTALETIAATSANQPAQSGVQSAERAMADKSPPSASDETQGQSRWWHVFLAGFLTVLLLELGALAIMNHGPGGYVLGLLAGGVALAIFLVARKSWLNVFLAGLVIAFFLWLGVAAGMWGLPFGLAAEVLALIIFAFAVKKWPSPRGFLGGFMTVFVLVFSASAVITVLLPDSFASTARLKITRRAAGASAAAQAPGVFGGYDPYFIQTELEVMQSAVILDKVIENLGLSQEWGKRYARGETLQPAETLGLLKRCLALHPVRDTTIIEICAFSQRPREAAKIANEITRVYKEYREEAMESATSGSRPFEVVIIDNALPGLRPVRPNKPLNLAIGGLAGLLLGTAAGAGARGYESRKKVAV
jgi:capsular polysaccharide biosynthesis protein